MNKKHEDVILLEYDYSFAGIPDFMVSPGIMLKYESRDVNKIIHFVFAEMLVKMIKELINEKGKKDFLQIIELLNAKADVNINELKELYTRYNKDNMTYLDLSRLIYNLEEVLERIGINFIGKTYANIYDARYSESMNN